MKIEMPTKGRVQRLWQLEPVRGLASVYVMLHHSIPHDLVSLGLPIGQLFRFGQEAVVVFFILSGFVIHYSVDSKADLSFRQFLAARFLRIYPLLFVALGLGIAFGRGDCSVGLLLANIGMLQDDLNRFDGWFGTFGGNHPLWSLSYEWWFYILYWVLRAGGKAWGGVHGRAVIVVLLSVLVYFLWGWQIARFGVFFAMWWSGVELARLYRLGRLRSFDSLGLRWLGAYIIIGVVLGVRVVLWKNGGGAVRFGHPPLVELRMVVAALLFAFIGWIWFRLGWIGFREAFGRCAFLASFSYGLYARVSDQNPLISN